MLVLSRQENQRIVIGDHIVITVASIRRGKVRLAIDAPKEVPVHRSEVYDSIAAKKGHWESTPSCAGCP